jgi:hypothetical protein
MMVQRRLLALFVLGIAAVIFCFYTFAPVAVWDGGFELTVNVSNPKSVLRSVKCEPFYHRSDAELAIEQPTDPSLTWSSVADPFVGNPLKVFVRVSGRDSMWGWKLSRMQFQWLAIIGLLDDGRQCSKVVEIPDGRVSRIARVSLP